MSEVQRRARELQREAVFHKRAATRHRKLARSRMQQLAEFCKNNGIRLIEIGVEQETVHGQTPKTFDDP